MRALFTAIVILGICGCAKAPYFDLRHPIYMVTDQSFWSGCETDSIGDEVCRKFRVAQVNAGIDDWFRHFDEAGRPQAVIVGSKAELPQGRVNKQVIYLKIDAVGSGNSAYYRWKPGSSPVIVFDNPYYISPTIVSHEFGHALGLDHKDLLDGISSIMLPVVKVTDYVLPADIDLLCRIHAECPLHEDTWCEGGFYDECLCPSNSYDEAKAALEAETLFCME